MEEVCRISMHSNTLFGGKTVILLGDFRQTCPIVRRGSKQDVLHASIKHSPLWADFQQFRLTQRIRHAEDQGYADFLDAVGDGMGPTVNLSILHIAQQRTDLINFVFPDSVILDPMLCMKRAILAVTNAQIDLYNADILHRLTGASRLYMAADSLDETDTDYNANTSPIPYASVLDYVARHPPIGVPPSALYVKVGGLYRIMRNFSIDRGLVKNARVLVTDVGMRLINIRLLRDDDSIQDEDILLPRITFTSRLPSQHTLIRKQFPIAPAYATTFNSCQGLTLDRMAIDVSKPAFSHGQLYTALSRIRRRNDGMVYMGPKESDSTLNVTYEELLL
jgi:hypothetical protein